MNIVESRTIIAIPPGYSIEEQIEIQGMTQQEFASRMNMSESYINQLINGEVQLTPEIAKKLESVLGIPSHFWNNLEARYREKVILAQEENAREGK